MNTVINILPIRNYNQQVGISNNKTFCQVSLEQELILQHLLLRSKG